MLDLPCFKLRATQNLPKTMLMPRMAAETVCIKFTETSHATASCVPLNYLN